MFKIEIDGKELKKIIEKALCNMNRKSYIPVFTKIILRNENNTLSAITSKETGYLEVKTDNYNGFSEGEIAVDEVDAKVLTKMTGTVELNEMEKNIKIKNGKRIISLSKYNIVDSFKEPADDYIPKMKMKESDFAETIFNLDVFTSHDDSNKLMCCFHFNLSDSRIEALDGYRIGMRQIKDTEKLGSGNFVINNGIVSDLKKTLDEKSSDNVIIFVGEKYIKVSGNKFTYYTENIKGEYFKVNKMIETDATTECEVNVEEMMRVVKYYTENVISKNVRKPVIFNFTNGKIATYSCNERLEVADEIDNNNFIGKNLTIGLNPYFILDALKIINVDNVKLELTKSTAPMFIKTKEYSFLLLPVNLKSTDILERMEEYYKRVDAA